MTVGPRAVPYHRSLCSLIAAGLCAAIAFGQEQKAAPPAPAKPANIQDSWDSVIQDVLPKAAPDPILTVPQTSNKKNAQGDFLNHFFFETRTDYQHTNYDFTGLPTNAGVINAPNTGIFNPDGIPYPLAFQPDANRIYSFIDFGTRGWLSDRVNTHFGVRYRQDLSHVDIASPNANILETFGASRRLELTHASVEIDSKPTDGLFAGTSIVLGRQYSYGAELAAFDGATFTLNRRLFSLSLFGGRRFTYFSDPEQRAIGGGSLTGRINSDTSITYDTVFYVNATHRVSFR